MKKELKRQIKEDELVTGMSRAWVWVEQHRDQVRQGAIVAAAVLLGVAAFSWFRSGRTQESEAAFSEALLSFHAPVAASPEPGAPPPGGPSFTSAQAKYSKALEQFDGVFARWGSLPAGRRARFYAALCRVELGQGEAAQQAFDELIKSGDAGLVAQVRLAQAQAQARAGRVDQALAALRQLAEEPQELLPRDYALLALAGALEDAQRAGEAAQAYERLANEFPESVFAAEARRRADYLKNSAS